MQKKIYILLGICVSKSDTFVTKFCTVVIKIFKLLFGINCTEIDQYQLNINSVYIIIMIIIAIIMETFMNYLVQKKL